MPIERSLFISGFSRFEFSKIDLKIVTGSAKKLPPPNLVSASGLALASEALGVPIEDLQNAANKWVLSLNDHLDNELTIDFSPRSMPKIPPQSLVTSKDIKFVTSLTCPVRLFLTRLNAECLGEDNLQRLAKMTTLKTLSLDGVKAMLNSYTSVLSNNRSIRELILDHQKLNEKQIGDISKISSLRLLQLNYTELTDEAVKIIASSLPDIECLHIGHMKSSASLTPGCLKSLKSLTKLNELSIRDCAKFDDTCVEDLSQLSSLRTLYVDQTSITPAGYSKLRIKLPKTTIY